MGGAAQALLQQSDCVESASEQVGVLGACHRSRSGLKTGSKSSKSSHRPGGQTVGLQIQLPGVKRLASPSGPPRGESVSPSGEISSDPLPLRQALDSVSTSVPGQGTVLQEPVPVGSGGHEDASSLKMHRPSSMATCQACLCMGTALSSSPGDWLCPLRAPVDGHCLAPVDCWAR